MAAYAGRHRQQTMRARIEGAELVTRSRFRARIFEAWGHRCAYCAAPAESLDHVIPKAQGGLTVAANLVPACLCCNRRKGHQEVISWWRLQRGWSQAGQDRLVAWMLSNSEQSAANCTPSIPGSGRPSPQTPSLQ